MQNYLLRHFLASHGLGPERDVNITEVSSPRMPHFLSSGRIDEMFAQEPFNQLTVYKGLGFIHTFSKDIWPGHHCCNFVTIDEFIERYPNTYRALLSSILAAQHSPHTADADRRLEIARELSAPDLLNQEDPVPVIRALSGYFPDGNGQTCEHLDHIDFVPTSHPEYGTWILPQA